MNSINRQSKNVGGISKFYLLPPDIYLSLSDPGIDLLRYLTVSSFNTAWEISAIYQSVQFSENIEFSPAGAYYEKTFSAQIAKDSPQTFLNLQSLLNRTWLMICQDQNGSWKLVGSQLFPLRLNFSVNPGAATSDLNHFDLRLSGNSPYPSVFIYNPFEDPPESPVQ